MSPRISSGGTEASTWGGSGDGTMCGTKGGNRDGVTPNMEK